MHSENEVQVSGLSGSTRPLLSKDLGMLSMGTAARHSGDDSLIEQGRAGTVTAT